MNKIRFGKTFIAFVFGIASLFFGFAPVNAQETNSSIFGEVRDSNDALIAGATITVTNDALGLERTAVTDARGTYRIIFLPAGTYTMTVELTGFGTVQVKNIVVRVSIDTNVPIQLQPRSVSENVTVEADANQPDATSSTIKHSVSANQVSGLPVFSSANGRSVLGSLPFLIPGVTPTSIFGGSANERGVNTSVNGSRPNSISYNLDGADNNDSEFNRAASPLPNPDALQEFTVITNNFQADLGRTSGAVINAVTKSGTDTFRGNARYILQDSSLNARNFFAASRGDSHLDTFGGQIGGPVIIPYIYNGKGKTQFFFDTEFTRTTGTNLVNFDFFSLKERSGDFSALPVSARPRDPLTGQPFPNGIIPDNRISPIAKFYLGLVPAPNSGDRNYTGNAPTKSGSRQFTTRIDHQIGKRDSLSGTYFYNFADSVQGSTTPPITREFFSETRNDSFSLRETHVFSASLVNQFTFAYSKFNSRSNTDSPETALEPSSVGFTGIKRQAGEPILPQILILGSNLNFLIGNDAPVDKTTWQIKDDVNLTRGTHSFKFGGEVRNYQQEQAFTGTNGQYQFGFNAFGTGFSTTSSLADFLLGIPSNYTQSAGLTLDATQRSYAFYFLDDWRATSNLTINYGVRYEFAPPAIEKNDQVSAFRPGQISKRFPNAPVGLLFAGDQDPVTGDAIPRAGYRADKNNFAPRLGIAYSPSFSSGWLKNVFKEKSTAIRAGFGVFYDQPTAVSLTQFSYVQPFVTTVTLNATDIRSAGGNFANPFGTLNNPFPIEPQNRNFVGRVALRPIDPDFRTAYAYHYNLTLQRQLPAQLLLDISYVGNNSFKLPLVRDLNAPLLTTGATVNNVTQRRPYTAFDQILSQESGGRSRYDSLQIQLSRRLDKGLTFVTSYVYGRAFDSGSNPLAGQGGALPSVTASASGVGFTNIRDFGDQFNWARSDSDRTHNFVLNYTYYLPKFKINRFLGVFANGWQIGGITQIRSGLPLTINQISDTSLRGFLRGRADYVGGYREFDPRERQTITVGGVARTGNFFFDPNAFAVVPNATFPNQRVGNLDRNVFNGPKLNLTSVSIAKQTRLFRENQFEIRLDINNLFNNTNFVTPATIVGLANFGIVTQAIAPRTMQASVRYSF